MAIVARQEIAVKALSFGDEAFKNALEQVIVLNPEIPLLIAKENIALNPLGGVLVEYGVDKSHHEIRVIPEVRAIAKIWVIPEAVNAPEA